MDVRFRVPFDIVVAHQFARSARLVEALLYLATAHAVGDERSVQRDGILKSAVGIGFRIGRMEEQRSPIVPILEKGLETVRQPSPWRRQV